MSWHGHQDRSQHDKWLTLFNHLTFFFLEPSEIDLFCFVAWTLFLNSNRITFFYLQRHISFCTSCRFPSLLQSWSSLECWDWLWKKLAASNRSKSLVNWPCPLDGASKRKMHLFLKIMLTLLLPVNQPSVRALLCRKPLKAPWDHKIVKRKLPRFKMFASICIKSTALQSTWTTPLIPSAGGSDCTPATAPLSTLLLLLTSRCRFLLF